MIYDKIFKIISDQTSIKRIKMEKIKKILFKLIDKNLYQLYLTVSEDKQEENEIEIVDDDENQTGGKLDKLVYLSAKEGDLSKYNLNNERDICEMKNKDKCNDNPHCHWTHNGCKFSITKKSIILFVNKIAEELASNDSKAFEIMQIGDYFVSDIVDKNNFTQVEGQTIIKSNGPNLKKALSNIFGKEYVPKIGRKKSYKNTDVNYQQLNIDNSIIDINELYMQKIIDNNMSIFRAYVNGYYWIKNEYNDIDIKNLGFYSPQQTELSTFFRSKIIDWLTNKKNKNTMIKDLPYLLKNDKKSHDYLHNFIIKLSNDELSFSNCLIELYALSKLNSNIPIIVYNEDTNILYVFDNGIKYNSFESDDSKILSNYNSLAVKKKSINIRFLFSTNKKIPIGMEIIYWK